jgi:AcrR family transcriptional regulator
VGLREKNKTEKLERIRRATLEVLEEKGFDATTIKEICLRAGVGHGTIFSYAPNKVELCLLSITDGLDRTAARTFANLDIDLPLIDQLIAFFRSRYLFWERHRELFFAATQALSGDYIGGSPPELGRAKIRRAHTRGCVLEMLSRSRQKAEIEASIDLDNLSSIILDIYLQELRFWLNDDTVQLDEGLHHLKSLFSTLIGLIAPRESQTIKRESG